MFSAAAFDNTVLATLVKSLQWGLNAGRLCAMLRVSQFYKSGGMEVNMILETERLIYVLGRSLTQRIYINTQVIQT